MRWIQDRIAELQASKDVYTKVYLAKETTRDEKSDVAVVLVHLSMHICDLERVLLPELIPVARNPLLPHT